MTTMQRPYNSVLREEQAGHTREVILEALAEQLTFHGLEHFSIPKVARRARVAVRTVYRYFPTRERMLEAISAWLDERVGQAKAPDRVDALIALVPHLFRAFADNASLIRAMFSTRNGAQFRTRANQERARNIEQAVDAHAPGLSAEQRTEAAALLHALLVPTTLFLFSDVYGLDSERAARTAQWAMRLVLDAVGRAPRD